MFFHLRRHVCFTNVLNGMGSKHLLPFTSPLPPLPSCSQTHRHHSSTLIFSKPIAKLHPISLRTSVFSYSSRANIPRPVPDAYLETPEVKVPNFARIEVLKRRKEELGVDIRRCTPRQYNHLLCPMAFADGNSSFGSSNQISEVKIKREITEENLELEPLCGELLAYFKERLISGETLRRNYVMQRKWRDQIIIAFTYRRNGVLVSCKYRDITKKFWQEKDTEKIFYGLDDIKEASDIIIVEGEMDKLSMEEAGFLNCVSVPDGAPASVSRKELPSQEKDRSYRYLWNCKEYLEKASRIILATDGDPSGQALAEELARRLGRERCWRVRWPKKNEADHFKDANEVLMYLGPDVLKEVIENALLYPIR